MNLSKKIHLTWYKKERKDTKSKIGTGERNEKMNRTSWRRRYFDYFLPLKRLIGARSESEGISFSRHGSKNTRVCIRFVVSTRYFSTVLLLLRYVTLLKTISTKFDEITGKDTIQMVDRQTDRQITKLKQKGSAN